MKAWFLSRDRRPFLWPAIAATLLNPLFWVMLLGRNPKRAAAGFDGMQVLEDFATFLGTAAILPVIGWAFASRSVFALMALGGVFAWPVWAMFVVMGLPAGVERWPELNTMDRIIGVVLTIQLLLWPLCFALLFRTAMGDADRTGWRRRAAALRDALRPRSLLARDRRRFGLPALAAALCNPLPWVLHLGPDPKRGTPGFGGWGTLDDFAILLLVGAVPALLGWLFASWTVFGILAWGGVVAWGAWLLMMHRAYLLMTDGWVALPFADQGMALILIAQALPYPLAFWLVLRVAMGWDRRA